MATSNTGTPTGSCYWMDEDGQLWLAESFEDADGTVTTTQTAVQSN